MKIKAVLIFSGGMDSTVLLYDMLYKGYDVSTISFDYNQQHKKELECVKYHTEMMGIPNIVIDLKEALKDTCQSNLISDSSKDIQEGPYHYVPFRNMLLLTIAAQYAESIGAPNIFYGAQIGDDEGGFWDCTHHFIDEMNHIFSLNTSFPIKLHAPYAGKEKSEIAMLGHTLGVEFDKTWSCYMGGELPCEECGACETRNKAFEEVHLVDGLIVEVIEETDQALDSENEQMIHLCDFMIQECEKIKKELGG